MALEIQPLQQNTPPAPISTPGPSKKSRNSAIVIIVVLVVIVVFAAIWFALKSLATKNETVTPSVTSTKTSTQSADIKSDSDLKKAEDELNNTNIDDFESDLKQNDTDAAQF